MVPNLSIMVLSRPSFRVSKRETTCPALSPLKTEVASPRAMHVIWLVKEIKRKEKKGNAYIKRSWRKSYFSSVVSDPYQIPYSEPSFEFTLIQESKPTHRPQPPSSNPIDESWKWKTTGSFVSWSMPAAIFIFFFSPSSKGKRDFVILYLCARVIP